MVSAKLPDKHITFLASNKSNNKKIYLYQWDESHMTELI